MPRLRPIEWLIIACLVLVCSYFLEPSGNNSYFSPTSLKSRYERYGGVTWLLPYSSGAKDSLLVDYLIEQDYWTPAENSDGFWILTGNSCSQWRDGQSYLHKVLYWHEEIWIDWSKQHPDLARVVWPLVLAALREDRSERRAVDLLDLGKYSTSVDDFKQRAAELPKENP